MLETLKHIINRLKSHADTDAVFLTGSYGTRAAKPHSDIDLVIIFKKNKNNLFLNHSHILKNVGMIKLND